MQVAIKTITLVQAKAVIVVVQATKECLATNNESFLNIEMKPYASRDILVLLKNVHADPDYLEQEVGCLHQILVPTESFEAFYKVHELVMRYRITKKITRLEKAFGRRQLEPFHFLICNN